LVTICIQRINKCQTFFVKGLIPQLVLNELNTQIGHLYSLTRTCYVTALLCGLVFIICCESVIVKLRPWVAQSTGAFVYVFVFQQARMQSVLLDECSGTFQGFMVVFPMKTKTYTNFFFKYIFHSN